jgi:hypothetical protein
MVRDPEYREGCSSSGWIALQAVLQPIRAASVQTAHKHSEK